MDPSTLQDFYRSAHYVCRIGPGLFPSAKAIQELSAAWKPLRKSRSTYCKFTPRSVLHTTVRWPERLSPEDI
jgi:hypothetical protein